MFSYCFGNSIPCVQIKSCDNVFDLIYPFYHSGLGESIPVSHQNTKTSKEIEVDISICLGYSLYADI